MEEQIKDTITPTLTTNYLNDFYKNGKPISDTDIGKLKNDVFILPPGTEKDINTFFNNLPNKKILKGLDNETKRTIQSLLDTTELSNKNNIGFIKELTELNNSLEVDNKKLRLKNLTPKRNSNMFGNMKLQLDEKLNIGVPVHVPLYHSGFWVTLSPLSTKIEKINLQLEITKEINRMGKKTHNLIFSNYSVMFAKVIVDTLRNKIIDSSLALPEGKDFFSYIKVQDLDILIWGLLKSMYPRGFDYIILCKNAITPDDDSVPTCNFKLNIKLDLHNMLKVDNNLFSIEQKKLMLKRSSKSVTIDDITTYQDTLECNEEDTININLDDYLINIVIKSPFIDKYLDSGENFVEYISEQINDLISKGTLKDNDENTLINAENTLVNSVVISIYNHYITSISLNGKVKSEYDDVFDLLKSLSSDDDTRNLIVDRILKYIDKSLVAIVGIPNYVCPTCKASQNEDKHNFNSFVGLDVYTYFFTLLAFQYQKATTGLQLK